MRKVPTGRCAAQADFHCVLHKAELLSASRSNLWWRPGACDLAATIEFEIREPIIFDCVIELALVAETDPSRGYRTSSRRVGWDITYLPRGRYLLEWSAENPALPSRWYEVQLSLRSTHRQDLRSAPASGRWPLWRLKRGWTRTGERCPSQENWSLRPLRPDVTLSWQKRGDDWFFKHFDHAARVIIHYMLDDSPLLRGRILDVGCGEGITDLGVFLRKQPRLLVGLDIEDNFRHLPRLMKQYGIPEDLMDPRLVFRQVDASRLPYADDYFDVVISWGSLEHVAGGYGRALREIKRVLKDGGLFFLHPGLYYSSMGHHLGEFTDEPFAHLVRSEEDLKRIVFTADPNLMDRGGLRYTREDFWRYYSELNRITVSGIERELRELGFAFKKVAVRAEDLVTYTDELQKYSIQDLTTREIYMTLANRK